MELREWEGMELFERHGIPVPTRVLIQDAAEDVMVPDVSEVVVKAQVPAGKREEHGGITIVDRGDAVQEATEMLGGTVASEHVDAVLLEEKVDIAQELYISLSIDRAEKRYRLVFSEQGGSGIESIADADPDAIHQLSFYEPDRETLSREFKGVEQSGQVVEVIMQMYELLREEDALLVEINPLAVTAGEDVVATDAKVRLDDNALERHDFAFTHDEREDALEAEAEAHGLEFVNLDGNIGVIGNGAGLVMATLDAIQHFGGRPADFLDIGGGADMDAMMEAMQVTMEQDDVDGVFVNIFGGITRCDEVAQGIIDFMDRQEAEIPLVVRMVGTNQEEGRAMLEDNGIHALDSMDACAEKIVELTGDTDAD